LFDAETGNYWQCWLSAGRGGASIYGKQFDDEITDELKHTGQSGGLTIDLIDLYLL